MFIDDEKCGRRVTLRRVDQPSWVPALYEVLIDGQPIASDRFSRGRVLAYGNSWMPILDGYNLWPWRYSGKDARQRCAEYVALVACTVGLAKRKDA